MSALLMHCIVTVKKRPEFGLTLVNGTGEEV